MDAAVLEAPESAEVEQVNEAEPIAEAVTRPNSPPPPTAEEIAVAKQEHYEAIREKEIEVRQLEGIHSDLAEQAKDAKKEFESADKALRFLIARGYEIAKKWPTRVRAIQTLIAPKIEFGQEFDVLEINDLTNCVRVLIDEENDPAGDWLPIGKEVEVLAWGERPMPPPPPAEPEPDESWKQESAAKALNMTASQAEKFAHAGVETMGQFEQMRADVIDRKATWPKGIGEATVTKLVEAAIDWKNGLDA